MNKHNIKLMIPKFWSLFKIYLNNSSYFVREDDTLAKIFGRGEEDVKDMISRLNKYATDIGIQIVFEYYEGLTYKNLLEKL